MRTQFSPEQLADPDMASSEAVLRRCVHCGFCTATCPTYALLGDELDSPRGRIYLIQNMLEEGGPPSPQTVKHLDRCLSCLSCMTTCPSDVNYMHLIDHARAHVERTYRRPFADRMLRSILSAVMTRAWLFRLSVGAATLLRWTAPIAPPRVKAMLRSARKLPPRDDRIGVFAPHRERRMRVALLSGCVQSAMDPGINAAAIRLLNRHGVEVVVRDGAGCCGALPHHLGKAERAESLARAQIEAWDAEIEGDGLDAVVTTTSGCGTTLKDYGFMFRDDAAMAAKAARVSGLARDITELIAEIGLRPANIPTGLTVAYHSACSLQHGQRVRDAPKALLAAAGFEVREPAEGHLCCGSAGTYSLLQPDISARLRDRKVAAIEATGPQLIAAGNLGCMAQIASGTAIPVVHTVELLDWATGGPKPAALP